MQTKDQILRTLRSNGHRVTAARQAILAILFDERKPLSAADIHALLARKKIQTDKVTVYRELEFLKKEGIAAGVQLQDRNRRYELASLGHHHHLICQKCNRVEDVNLKGDLEEQERRIKKQKNFKVLRHSLEFFGLCANCR